MLIINYVRAALINQAVIGWQKKGKTVLISLKDHPFSLIVYSNFVIKSVIFILPNLTFINNIPMLWYFFVMNYLLISWYTFGISVIIFNKIGIFVKVFN